MMMPVNPVPDNLSDDEKQFLLILARRALENAVRGKPPPSLSVDTLSENLRQEGASFVTLTRKGMLRGCIGALEPNQSLAEDVMEHAAAAAMEDYRFTPVQENELATIHIEISRLTTPKILPYENSQDLVKLLRPGIDGVVLQDGFRRATFLPQVWEKITRIEDFLAQLCMKMGARSDTWMRKKLDVLVYQVEEFKESG